MTGPRKCMADELLPGAYCDQPARAVRETYRADHPLHLCPEHAGQSCARCWSPLTTRPARISGVLVQLRHCPECGLVQ